jgi:tetratricopeptide (TPR) repeat protein
MVSLLTSSTATDLGLRNASPCRHNRAKMARMDRQRQLRAGLMLGLCAALLGESPSVGAQSDDENARRHFESGTAYLQQSDYDDALREFQAAYNLSRRPQLLINIANVYERMGRLQEALDTLKHYLTDNPKATDTATTEGRIANLQRRIEVAGGPAADAGAAAPTSSAPPAVSAAPPAVSAAVAASQAPPAESVPPAQKASLPANRAPAYVAFGIGGAAAIGAVITGIAAQARFNKAKSQCKPDCSLDEVKAIESLALASDIFTGLAVAGAGVGAVLFFTAKPRTSETGFMTAPAVRASAGPGGARVEAAWGF